MNMLAAAFLLFIAAAFALPSEAASGLVFYLTILPLVAWRCRNFVRLDPALGLTLSLVAWSGLSLAWGEDPGHRDLGFAVATLCTGVLVAGLHEMLAVKEWRRRAGTFLVWAGTCNAAWSLLIGLPGLLAGERILGWGITRQPILGGAVMSLAYLTALSRAVSRDCPARNRRRYVVACCVMAMFVLAMQSRGALLAATGGTVILLAFSPWKLRAAAAMIAIALAWLVLVPAALRLHATRLIVARGTSHRLDIWRVTWSLIRQKPVFGHGLAANVPPSPTGFPHSLYLSLLFYSGAVGLLLFLAIAGVALRRLAGNPDAPDRAWVAAICASGLLAGLTDLGQITKGPGPIWFIIWMPLTLALTPPGAVAAPLAPATLPPPPDAAKVSPPVPRTPARD